MSYARNADIIYQTMDRKKIRYWQVFDADKTSQICESSDSEDITVEDSINDLKAILDSLEGLVYVIIRLDTAVKKRKAESIGQTIKTDVYAGIYKFQLKLGDTASISGSGSSSGFGSGNVSMFTMLLNMQKEKHDADLKHLEEKTSLEKSFTDQINKLSEKIEKRGSISGQDDLMNKKIFEVLDRLLTKK
jgi:hypothetical protein